MASSRPSRRSIRAGTAGNRVASRERETSPQPQSSGMHAVNRRVLSVNPQHTIEPIDIGKARDLLGKELREGGYGFDYKTAAQLKKEAQSSARSSFGTGNKYQREVAYQIRVNKRSQSIRFAAEIQSRLPDKVREMENKALADLRKKATAAEEAERVADRRRKEDIAAGKETERATFEGLKPNKRSLRVQSAIERDNASSILNAAEAAGRAKMAESPDDQRLFGEFTVGIEDDEVQRLQDVAQNSFDEYYERQEGFVRAELAIKLKNLNEKFNIFSKESQFFLERNIGEIDRDTAEDLLDMVNNAQVSGTLDSGLLRAAADKIVEMREFDVEGEEMKAEFARQKAVLAKETGIATAELTADKALDVQAREKEEAERTRFTENLQEEDNRRKMEQERAATELNEDFEDPNAVSGNRAGPAARSQIKPREFTPPNLNFSDQQRAEISRSGKGSRGGSVPSRFAGQLKASTNVTGAGRQQSRTITPSRSTVARANTNTGRTAITARSSGGSLTSRAALRRTARGG